MSAVPTHTTATRLRVTEMVRAFQGDMLYAGFPTFLIRLTGCPLRCRYCDATHAFHGGTHYEVEALVEAALQTGVRHVTITGGEPLAQKHTFALLKKLCEARLCVVLESSAALDIALVDRRVVMVLDIKTPSSNEGHRNVLTNLVYLKPTDQAKFIIADYADYQWAKDFVALHVLAKRCMIVFTPNSAHADASAQLAHWMTRDAYAARFQMRGFSGQYSPHILP